MRKPLACPAWLVPLFVSAVALAALTLHLTPFTGTWQLSVAKSQFRPGPGPKRETVTLSPEGTTTFEGVDAEGNHYQASYPWSGGAKVPIQGIENATVIDQFQGNTWDHTMMRGKGTQTAHGVLSKDGRTATFTVTGTDEQGRPVHHVEVYQKQ